MKVSPEIMSLVPYAPGKPIEETQREYNLDRVYKLASNENLLGISPKVKEALKKEIESIHRYPDGSCYKLKEAASQHYGLSKDKMVFSSGSDEMILLLIRSLCTPQDKILISTGSFILYKIIAQGCRVKSTMTPMKKNYSIDLEAIKKAWTPEHRIVFIPNPNNPTGSYFNKTEFEDLLRFFKDKKDTLLVIDEAYCEFVTAEDYPDAVASIKDMENLAVLRTLSKDFGLAGLRIGCLLANKEIIQVIERVRTPFNVNNLAQAAAVAAFSDTDFVAKARKLNREGLDYFEKELGQMNLPFVKSEGNFIFFDSLRDSGVLYEELLKKGLILRPLKPYGFETQLRMSVGLREENEAAIRILKEVLPTVPVSNGNNS